MDVTASHDILLVGINTAWVHTAFGLRYLKANLGPLASRCAIYETTVKQRPLLIAEAILEREPRVVGIGVYIWNVEVAEAVVRLLKTLRPDLPVVLGGPEVSHEWDAQRIVQAADHVVIGEGEVGFRALCGKLLAGEQAPHIVRAPPPDTAAMTLPYELYAAEDIAKRVIYVEASRGCPFRCEFCLSALDKKVRAFPLPALLAALDRLIDRGARAFKFVDRTFNLSPKTSEAILTFLLDRHERTAADGGLFVHFEMIPDRFPARLRELVARFAPGSIQLEVGVQTLDPEVAARIDRRQDMDATLSNLRFVAERTDAHVHADLIVGLPGEGIGAFGRGFDRLLQTGVREVQVGILKRLRGAPISRHDAAMAMVYSPLPPYEILQTAALPRADLSRLRRFAQCWDDVANSGRYPRGVGLLLQAPSAFEAFLAFSDEVHARGGRSGGLSLDRWLRLLFDHLHTRGDHPARSIAAALVHDRRAVTSKRHVPPFLRPWVDPAEPAIPADAVSTKRGAGDRTGPEPARQRRHRRS